MPFSNQTDMLCALKMKWAWKLILSGIADKFTNEPPPSNSVDDVKQSERKKYGDSNSVSIQIGNHLLTPLGVGVCKRNAKGLKST